ncbi:unnamed protein product [Timema podura]|uniref:NADH dehydrogenase subunit 4 n=1 Tax=Timema podura TaxID=61482 RepID=A0ABN7PLT1_TIMPD|nr:unnamed protein product [Timema podura]
MHGPTCSMMFHLYSLVRAAPMTSLPTTLVKLVPVIRTSTWKPIPSSVIFALTALWQIWTCWTFLLYIKALM